MTAAFGQALLDYHRGEQERPLIQRDGDETLTHPIEDFYFTDFEDDMTPEWLETWLDGPLLDMGAGAGRDTLYFQEQFETVALEVSEPLVTLLGERGVEDVRRGDMFALPDQFDRDRFRSALAVGTQVGLAKSRQGLRAFLGDLAHVTKPDGKAIIDGYDPTFDAASEMLGFRPDPSPGLAFRVLTYEYGDVTDETLLLRLFSPDRLQEATTGTDWSVAEVRRPGDAYYYRAALTKR